MKKTVKSYNEEGVRYQFDSEKMLMYATKMKSEHLMQGKKMNKSCIMKELAEKLYVSDDAVKSWMYGNNGPSDLEQVKKVADYFGVEYHQLLTEEEEKMTPNNNTMITSGIANEFQLQYTKTRIRELYFALLDSIDAVLAYYQVEKTYYSKDEEDDELKEKTNDYYKNAKEACYKIDEFLERNMLDIPEKIWRETGNYLHRIEEAIYCILDAFNPDDDVPKGEIEEDIRVLEEEIDHFRYRYHLAEFRDIFSDYIVR